MNTSHRSDEMTAKLTQAGLVPLEQLVEARLV
jgi:hypothetical protein